VEGAQVFGRGGSLRPSGFAQAYDSAVRRFQRRAFLGVEEGAEKVPERAKSVPQRLKPNSQHAAYGTAKAVPLSKTGFFSSL
jgi:hypothetical protein